MTVERDPADMSADDARDLKVRRETDKQKAKRVKAAWEEVLAHEAGRTVVWDIIARAGMLMTPIVPGDTHATYANIGRADYGRQLYVEVGNAYPARLLEMEKENMR